MVLVLIGVSGSGKTTVGQLLAHGLDWKFYEGDDYHPEANRQKMSEGLALNDADRAPWLDAIRALIRSILDRNENAVISCSALKQAYRDLLAMDGGQFVYLKGERWLIAARIRNRKGHFFDPGLLTSQFHILDEPHDALVVDASESPATIVREIERRLDLKNGSNDG